MIGRAAVERAVRDLDRAWLVEQRWFGGKGRPIAGLELAEAFALDERTALAIVRVGFADRGGQRISLPLVANDGSRGGVASLRPAEPGDGAWRALALAARDGRVVPALADDDSGASADGTPTAARAALVCRPAGRLQEWLGPSDDGVTEVAERSLGVDQSNTSVVLAERVVLKAFRRVETGLEPDLELTAFLSEEARFGAVPALAGSVELVSATDGVATLAVLSEYVPDAADGYETTAEQLTSWILAPGTVTVEFATEDAEDLGLLTAALHAALLSRPDIEGFASRVATRDELRAWREAAAAGLDRAVDVSDGRIRERLRALAPSIAEHFSVHEAVASAPLVSRVHGDYHLGQVMRSAEGWRIIDFEGEPTRPLEERRRHASPLRDVASMLRSLHHVGLSAARRARERGGAGESAGLDLDGWLLRSRERFLAAYRHGLLREGQDIVDEDLLLAFELEKACYEFVYAATYLPSWAEIALGGLEGLLAWADEGRA